MRHPLVSVVIPAFNSADFIGRTLASVFAQTWQPLEVIVVDDGSTDGTAGVVQGTSARLIRQENQGPPAARNRGVCESRGDFIAFLDSDDVWMPQKMARQMAFLQAHPKAGFVVCRMTARVVPGAKWPASLRKSHWDTNPPAYLPSGLLVRRDAFQTVGEFDVSMPTGDDSDWFFRARDAGIQGRVLEEVLLEKTVRPGSVSSRVEESNRSLLRQVRQSLVRKRAGHGS
jgi:glycosyltransferase involved in cell wall biosynthesis